VQDEATPNVPSVVSGEPRAGRRVWQSNPGHENSKIAHALYLPTDWQLGQTYPVLFEYPGKFTVRDCAERGWG